MEKTKWYEDWEIITRTTSHNHIIEIISLPNLTRRPYVFTFEVYEGDPLKDLIELFESALFEISRRDKEVEE